MIAVDTNVLLRLLVAEDPEQTRRAVAFVTHAVRRKEPIFVPDVVLCELVWVLSSVLAMPRQETAARIRQVLAAREMAFRDAAALEHAIASYERGRGDFADHVIQAQARAAGCETVATFDKALHKLPGFVAV